MQGLQNRILLLMILGVSFYQLQGQIHRDDLQFLKELTTRSQQNNEHEHHVSFLLSDHTSAVVKYNPVTLTLGSLMWVYQKIISPQFSSACLYSPSCSGYSKNLISEFGIIRGVFFSADRLSRCNRLALMDFKIWEADSKTGKIFESTDYYKLK